MRKGGFVAVLACGLAACWANLDGFTGGGAKDPDGGVTTDGNVGLVDGGTDGTSAPSDAGADGSGGRLCDPTQPFGKPEPITTLNGPSDEGSARLSPDELTVYFQSSRAGGAGGQDVYVAKRSSILAQFSNPEPVKEVNTGTEDFNPTISADGLTLIVSQKGGVDQDLFAWTRKALTDPFGQKTLVPNVSSAQGEFQGFLTVNGTLAFSRGALITSNIFIAGGTLPAFTGASNQSALNDKGVNGFPVLSNDERTVYFASTRPGGAGVLDIWAAKRAAKTDAFGSPTRVVELASAYDDVPTWVSGDDCRIYFGSTRPGGQGSADIWFAARPK